MIVQGTHCDYNPFAQAQATPCGRALDTLTRRGIAYTLVPAPGWSGHAYQVRIGDRIVDAEDPAALEPALAAAGYRLEKQTPPFGQMAQVVLAIIVIGFLSGMTYGPVAALLVEMFPARVRYTSLSVPYHIGTGYFGDSCRSSANISSPGPAIRSPASGTRSRWWRWPWSSPCSGCPRRPERGWSRRPGAR